MAKAALTHKIMVLFMDNEVRTFEEIQEWLASLIKPETAYRAHARNQRSHNLENRSMEESVREGVRVLASDTVHRLLWIHRWLEEADNKLEENRPPIRGDFSFKITPRGRRALRGLGFKTDRAGKSFRTQVWELVQYLCETGRVRIRLTALDGSPISGACLRNSGFAVQPEEEEKEAVTTN